jgi:regulator of nonsense transcripts 2
MQDKVEQQHLKRLVLDYEQREEAEEFKGQDSCISKMKLVISSLSY